jgi:Surfeit locus protein 5 subunit 22 of Mediator complex
VVRSAEVSDHASNARAEFQTRVDAAGLAQAAEGLLRLVSELKVAAIVQDTTASADEAAEVRATLESHSRTSTAELAALRDVAAEHLAALEEHYFESQCRVTVGL